MWGQGIQKQADEKLNTAESGKKKTIARLTAVKRKAEDTNEEKIIDSSKGDSPPAGLSLLAGYVSSGSEDASP